MGSQRQEVEVVWDTGSRELVVNDSSCDETCDNLVYNSELSDDFRILDDEDLDERVYGSTYVAGFTVFDTVCLLDNPETCVSDFQYFANVYVEGMEGIYGIVGMATGFDQSEAGEGKALIPEMYKAGVISEPVFGWYTSRED